jgi:Alginate export
LPWLNGYAQSVDAHALGMPWQYTTSSWKDNFDLHQAFLEFHMRGVAVFAGRQELKFGGERLVVLSDWANVGRSFDGFAAKFGDRNRITLFTASVVKNHPTSFDNHVGGLNFHGLFASFNTWLPHTSIEPYVYVRALPSVLSQQGIYGTETETTPGLRFLANAPLGFDVIAEAALQRGSYSNDSIHAGAGYIKTGYTARSLAWRPRLMGEYSYATGNPHRNPQRISTFDQLYPTSHNAFGLVDLFGWQNIRLERVHLDVSPSARLSLLLQREYVQVATRRDNVYAENGTVFAAAPANGFASEQLGRGFDISMKYQMTQFVAMTAGAAHFSPGALMNEAGYGAPLTFGYLSFTYRIRIARDKQAPNF